MSLRRCPCIFVLAQDESHLIIIFVSGSLYLMVRQVVDELIRQFNLVVSALPLEGELSDEVGVFKTLKELGPLGVSYDVSSRWATA
jgi:hypothetical protein